MTAASKKYATPEAFRVALVNRYKEQALRTRACMERFVVRLAEEFGPKLIVKGGVALAMRSERPRHTKDVDVTVAFRTDEPEGELLRRLQRAGAIELGDFFSFKISVPRKSELTKPTYGGKRFSVEAIVAGKVLLAFALEASFGEVPAPEWMDARMLDFVEGLERRSIPIYPAVLHIAEKLHAYSERRTRNTRYRDLPDIIVLARGKAFEANQLRRAIVETFAYRKTHNEGHDLPAATPPPPASWIRDAPSLHLLAQLEDFDELFPLARAFLDPVLAGREGVWDPVQWLWKDAAPAN